MTLYKEVIGFYPNWLSQDLYLNLRYDAVTTISYFGLKVQTNGSLYKVSYPPTGLINTAHSNNVKVVVSLISDWGSTDIDTILSSTSVQTTLINNLLHEVQVNNFDGVDIDLEGFPAINRTNGQSNKTLFTKFIMSLSNKFRTANPNYRLSIDIPAADWDNVFDVSTLKNYVDYLMIMGYDYHWATGPTAGAVAPLNSSNNISVTNSVNAYIQTIPKNKLLLGVPYYGYEWRTMSNALDSTTVGSGVTVTYAQAVTNKITIYPRQWESTWASPYYMYQSGNQWNQGWYDDVQSLSLKYDLVNNTGIAGIGIWALGYDSSYPELSNLIVSKFSTPPPITKYDCINNQCVPSDTGQYTDSTCGGLCNPPITKYDCINYQCIPSTTGPYTDSTCGGLCNPPPLICNPGYTKVLDVCIPQNYILYGEAFIALYVLYKLNIS